MLCKGDVCQRVEMKGMGAAVGGPRMGDCARVSQEV